METLPLQQTATDEAEEREISAGIVFAGRVAMAKRYAKRKDILNWGRTLFPEKFNLPFCKRLHGYFVEIRADEKTNTEAPRNHAKTTIKCFLIPLFQALEEPETFNHYLNVQSTGHKSLAINVSIRAEIENNPLIHAIYGNQIGLDKWTDQQFVLRNGVIFTAVGAGQSIRGLNWHNVRPDYVIVDDLYDEEDINNPESTLKKNQWFWGSLYPARAKSRRCSLHIQGTAINNEDLLDQLKKKPRWKSASFKAVENWDTKEVLWPELNTFDSLDMDRADMGSIIFYRELQNERRDEASAIIKSSWLEGWEYEPQQLWDLIGKGEHLFVQAVLIGNDPSIGERVENDYTGTALVIKTCYRDGGGNDYWIHGLWMEHLSLDARILQLKEICSSQPKGMEVTQANVEGIAGFKDYVAELTRRTNIPVHEIDKVPDKITNLENKSHYFENKKVHLNKHIGFNSEGKDLKDQLKFQLTVNHPRYDDLRDSVLLTLEASSGLWNFVL